ncbi:dihydropteroate synthase [Kaarinaea lacus]
MGILNVTPDSFSDGGQFVSVDSAMQQSRNMVADGAAIIDIGGESTRPGAKVVSIDEERQRVLPVIKRIQKELPDTIISIDTSKPEIMANAIVAGAHVVNDVNALRAPGAVDVIAGSNVAVCLMHMQGEPRTMQKDPHYNNVVEEVFYFLQQRVEACLNAGIDKSRIIVDPGFGFGKNLEHNLLLFKQLKRFKELGVALLVGVSRKSMIGAILDKPIENRLIGSISLATLAAWMGADILRVHDVGATNDALKTVSAVRSV